MTPNYIVSNLMTLCTIFSLITGLFLGYIFRDFMINLSDFRDLKASQKLHDEDKEKKNA